MRFFFCIAFAFSFLTVHSQQDSATIHSKLQLIHRVTSFIRDSLHLQVKDDFYREWQQPDSMIAYLYVSKPDTVKSVLKSAYAYYGTDDEKALQQKDSFDHAGMHTMLYKTAGTSGAKLSTRLLQYPDEAIAFIVFHESVHQHLGNHRNTMPYDYEEALGDLVGNEGTKLFFGKDGTVKTQARVNEKLYDVINRYTRKADPKGCEKKIGELLKQGNAFQKDRFGYPVNNAYFLRYRYYARNYFVLEKKYRSSRNLHLFMDQLLKQYEPSPEPVHLAPL